MTYSQIAISNFVNRLAHFKEEIWGYNYKDFWYQNHDLDNHIDRLVNDIVNWITGRERIQNDFQKFFISKEWIHYQPAIDLIDEYNFFVEILINLTYDAILPYEIEEELQEILIISASEYQKYFQNYFPNSSPDYIEKNIVDSLNDGYYYKKLFTFFLDNIRYDSGNQIENNPEEIDFLTTLEYISSCFLEIVYFNNNIMNAIWWIIPEDVSEAIRIQNDYMALQKDTMEKLAELEKRKAQYYWKYWSWLDKVKNYFN